MVRFCRTPRIAARALMPPPMFTTGWNVVQPRANMATQQGKYCRVCGRLISPNHRNFEDRKHCGKSCSATRLSAVDRSLEQMFINMSKSKGSVDCSEVQDHFMVEGNGPKENQHSAGPISKHEAGMDQAQWRERVRRAARRVIAFEHNNEGSFQCVQKGKAVEPSFAKGEWTVRFVRP